MPGSGRQRHRRRPCPTWWLPTDLVDRQRHAAGQDEPEIVGILDRAAGAGYVMGEEGNQSDDAGRRAATRTTRMRTSALCRSPLTIWITRK